MNLVRRGGKKNVGVMCGGGRECIRQKGRGKKKEYTSQNSFNRLISHAQIVLSRRRDLLVQEPDMVHTFLCSLPQDPTLDIDEIVASAVELERKFPPLEVQKRSGIWLDDWWVAN